MTCDKKYCTTRGEGGAGERGGRCRREGRAVQASRHITAHAHRHQSGCTQLSTTARWHELNPGAVANPPAASSSKKCARYVAVLTASSAPNSAFEPLAARPDSCGFSARYVAA